MAKTLRIGANLEGARADAALAAILPETSLRERRRLLESGQILVNGAIARPGKRLKTGDALAFLEKHPDVNPDALLLNRQKDYCFFFKPQKLHTTALAGKPSPSLEAILPGLCTFSEQPLHLLQRLDYNTCGIVAAAFNQNAQENFRQLEKTGQTVKFYLTRLVQPLPSITFVKSNLDTTNRKKTRIIDTLAPPDRWTQLWPLGDNSPWTIACIQRGQRHQIRAHAAYAGYPLTDDDVYGEGSGDFWLRCIGMKFSDQKFIDLEARAGAFPFPEIFRKEALQICEQVSAGQMQFNGD